MILDFDPEEIRKHVERLSYHKENDIKNFMSREDHGGIDENILKTEIQNSNLISKYQDFLTLIRKTKAEVIEPFNSLENEIIDKIKKLRNG